MSVELLLAIFGAASSIVYGFYLIAKWAVGQFESRITDKLKAQDEARKETKQLYENRLAGVEAQLATVNTRFLEHLAKLPIDYMRREDHIRFETAINAKLDAVAAKQDQLLERIASNAALSAARGG